MPKFSASIKITASENFSKAAQKIKRGTDKVRRGFDKADVSSKKFTHGLDRLGRRSLVAIGAGFAAVAVKGAKFQESMQDLSALTGLTGTALDSVGDNALGLSKKYGTSAARIVEAVKLVGSARSELLDQPDALLSITEQALVLSKAARIDLSSAVDSVTTSMNQFGLETEDSTRIINVLAAGAKVGASEIFETSAAIERAGVGMKIANVSFEEGNAAIQVLAKSGIKGERAGTALKTALLKLASSKIESINPTMVGIGGSLDALAAANLNAADLTQLFGLEAVAAGKILIDNRKLLGEWTKEMSGTTTATEQATTNMDTVANRAKKFGAVISEQLIGVFTDNESELSSTLDRLLTDFEKFRPIEQIFGGIASGLGLIVKNTQSAAVGIANVVSAWEVAKAGPDAPDEKGIIDTRNLATRFIDARNAAQNAQFYETAAQQGPNGTVDVKIEVDQYGTFSATAKTQGPGLTAIVDQSGSMLPAQ